MNILYIAYSCLPDKGSEEKIGWNVPLESAKTNKVFVVTKEEHRRTIEDYIKEHNITNPKFFFVDIPKVYKKVFKGSAYSVRLNIWHKKALPVVENICKTEKVDVIHQVTPIEFRSIGDYHKISDVKFVCGPLGGGEYIPKGLNGYALSHFHIEILRAMLNWWYKLKYKVTKKLTKCDYFLFANKETQNYLEPLVKGVPGELFFDNGIGQEELSTVADRKDKSREGLTFLVAGRMAYRKGHRLLIDAIREIPKDRKCKFKLVGGGPCLKKLQRLCRRYHLEDRVEFTGRISFSEMADEYKNADAFIMPSIRETTGAVLLEAASYGLPVISINRFGGPVLFDDDSAYFYKAQSKAGYIEALRNAIAECLDAPETVRVKGCAAADRIILQTWENKLKKYNEIYGWCVTAESE